ncbi:MAG: hypothetical protein Q7S97_06745 [Polaromonas sp.]|nr:hypothetical protein [Polaromonas sp.]
MSSTTRSTRPDDEPPLSPGGKPVPSPTELPVEPDLGPVPPMAHPEEPGMVRPAL